MIVQGCKCCRCMMGIARRIALRRSDAIWICGGPRPPLDSRRLALCGSQGAPGESPGYRAPAPRGRRGAGRGAPACIAKRFRLSRKLLLPRKEVIQPHVPVRLPCYDFTPLAPPTFDASLLKGWADGFG